MLDSVGVCHEKRRATDDDDDDTDTATMTTDDSKIDIFM